MGAAGLFLHDTLGLVELPQFPVDLRKFKVNLLFGMLLQQRQKPREVFVKLLVLLYKQTFPFQQHTSVTRPYPIAHEAVEEIFPADVLEITVKVVIGPPQQPTEINLLLRIVGALLEEILIMLDQGQLAFVVGEVDAEEPPGVPRIHGFLRFLPCDERLFGILNPESMAARRTKYHLLAGSDVIVIQHLPVRIQDCLIDQFRLQVAAFQPSFFRYIPAVQ